MYTKLTNNSYDRTAILAGAERYIRADRTDPFTRDRVMSHIHAGLCNPTMGKDGNKMPNHYDAKEGRESRSFTRSDGTVVDYEVPSFSDIKRL